ncbi:DUF943 family protein [Enterobacter huaxiensis]|uniref:DUF943 family protein n=1 Tax=Enterobacter huaxiensis TaxID=2494702 RepID=UPI003966E84D
MGRGGRVSAGFAARALLFFSDMTSEKNCIEKNNLLEVAFRFPESNKIKFYVDRNLYIIIKRWLNDQRAVLKAAAYNGVRECRPGKRSATRLVFT